jgi:hypothetical protein
MENVLTLYTAKAGSEMKPPSWGPSMW